MTTIQRYGNTRGLEGLPTISQFVVHDGVVHLLGVTGDPDEPPVRVCVRAELWQPDLLVEVMVTAAVGGADR